MFEQEIAGFRLVLADDRVLCVEGVQKLLSITETEVEIKLRRKVLNLRGEDIRIRCIECGRMVLEGIFAGFELK